MFIDFKYLSRHCFNPATNKKSNWNETQEIQSSKNYDNIPNSKDNLSQLKKNNLVTQKAENVLWKSMEKHY